MYKYVLLFSLISILILLPIHSYSQNNTSFLNPFFSIPIYENTSSISFDCNREEECYDSGHQVLYINVKNGSVVLPNNISGLKNYTMISGTVMIPVPEPTNTFQHGCVVGHC